MKDRQDRQKRQKRQNRPNRQNRQNRRDRQERQTQSGYVGSFVTILVCTRSAPTESEEKAILVSESGLFLTLGSGTGSARNENLRPLLNTNIPLFTWGPD